MWVKHEWVTLENGDRRLKTTVRGLSGKVTIPAKQVTEAKTKFEQLEDDLADKLLLQIYPDKRDRLEPVLKGLMQLVSPLVKGDVGTAMLLTRMIADVRSIAYSNPPVEVSRLVNGEEKTA